MLTKKNPDGTKKHTEKQQQLNKQKGVIDFMKDDKKVPAPVVAEQAENSTIEHLRNNINGYGLPKKIFFDDYNLVKSKSN